MIDFELSENTTKMKTMVHMLAENMMRPIAREYDENEHGEKPWDFINMMWENAKERNRVRFEGSKEAKQKAKSDEPDERAVMFANLIEELSWGDCAENTCAEDHINPDLGFSGSIVRWPELVGNWHIHRDIARSEFSPGLRANGSAW